jgi:hypothetical protein
MSTPPPIGSSPGQLSFDFSELVARARNLDASSTQALLGHWLVTYEPGPLARSRAAERAPVRSER